MYLEIAQIEVKAGMEVEFESSVGQAVDVFKGSRGCSGMSLRRSVENPSRYLLFVNWDTLEDHMDHFRNDPNGLQTWRKLVSHCYAVTPTLEHSQIVVPGFRK